MKKTLLFMLGSALFVSVASIAFASILGVQQGGTGVGNVTSTYLLWGNGINPFGSTSTLTYASSTGNVSIGSSTASDTLTVYVNGYSDGILGIDRLTGVGIQIQPNNPSINFNDIYINANHYLMGAGYSGQLTVSPSTGEWDFYTGTNAGAGRLNTLTQRMTMLNSGLVGINSTAPTSTLIVAGNFVVTGSSTLATVSSTNISASGYLQSQTIVDVNGNKYSTSTDSDISTTTVPAANQVAIWSGASSLAGFSTFTLAGGGTSLTINANTLFGAGVDMQQNSISNVKLLNVMSPLTVGALNPLFTAYGSGTILISTTTAPLNALIFVASTTPIFSVLNNNFVGINTSAPTSSLAVIGNLVVTGSSTLATVSSTNISASGYLASANVSSTNVSSTNIDAAGYINVASTTGYRQGGNTIVYVSSTIFGTFMGYQAGLGATANYLTAVGYQAMPSGVTGSANNAFGYQALQNLTGGTNNMAFGFQTGQGITSGSNNVMVGQAAGQSIGANSRNIAIGTSAVYRGTSNIGIGFQAMWGTSDTAQYNVGIGDSVLTNLSTGSRNVCIVSGGTCTSLTTGSNNLVIGTYQLDIPNGSNQLDINNLIYGVGTGEATGQTLSAGFIGISEKTPPSKFTVGLLPPQTPTSTLVLLGSNYINGGNASGTFLGANPTSGYSGDFVNFQVNSSSVFLVGSSTVTTSRNLGFTTSSVTVSACGTSPSVVGSNNVGTITTGSTGVTSCTLTFASPTGTVPQNKWVNAPVCTFSDNSSPVTVDVNTVSSSSLVLTISASITSVQIYYACFGNPQ